jgi:hypothetical protein
MIFDASYLHKDQFNRRERHGRPWTDSEMSMLERAFCDGINLEQMCQLLQRPAQGVVPKLEKLGLIRRDGPDSYTVIGSTTAPNPTQTEEINMPNIETKTLIRGRDAAHMDDTQIFALIGKLEDEVKVLLAIANKPKKLLAAVESLRSDIKQLVVYVDGR